MIQESRTPVAARLRPWFSKKRLAVLFRAVFFFIAQEAGGAWRIGFLRLSWMA